MQNEHLSLLRSLKQRSEEITPQLEAAQMQVYGEKRENGIDMIMSELVMAIVLLTTADGKVSIKELEFINDVRHVVYGYGISELTSDDYMDLCKKYLQLHPGKRMTIDHLPISISLLDTYDGSHGTAHADKARTIFLQFAETIIKSDNNQDPIENILFMNFRDAIEGKMS